MAKNKKNTASQAPEQIYKKNKPVKADAKNDKKGVGGKAAKPGIFTRIKTYFKDVKSEMQRVVWPTRKELINASGIVIGALVFFGVLIAIVDNVVVIPLDLLSSLGVN